MKKIGSLLIILLICCVSHGQICSGSLGDPVVNVTFGTGGNPGSPLSTVSNNYVFTSVACPGDGVYTLVNSTANCFNSTWHTLTEDHTPNDVNGYMMLVNGSFSPGDFYVDTVKGLCPNTTYEFAAWVLNILKSSSCNFTGIKPNLTFKIQTTAGVDLGTYSTGDIASGNSPAWNQYGLFFKTPAGVSNVILRITNNAPGGCGNDLVLDDITFRPCGPTVRATINYGGGTSLVDVCQGDAQLFTLAASVSIGYNNPAYQWQVSTDSVQWKDISGATSPNYNRNPTATGDFSYRLAVAEAGNISSVSCRVVSNILTVRVNINPVINASVNKPVCEQGALDLQASGGSAYLWTGPGGFSAAIANPKSIATTGSNGKYLVKVTTARGCSGTDSVIVQVFPKAIVDAGADQKICEGEAVALHSTSAVSYLWSPAATLSSNTIQNPTAKPVDSTMYLLTIKDANGCSASDSVKVNVSKKPFADAGAEVQMFQGQSATLNGTAKGTNIKFLWSPTTYMTNTSSLSPSISPPDTISYTLTVTSNDGCGTASDKVFVRVYQKVIIPNAFSPNGDGINDVWNIEKLQSYNNCEVVVFNRYGQIVFKSVGYSKKFDGTLNGNPLPFGTYYYTLDLKNGTKVTSGWVLIVR